MGKRSPSRREALYASILTIASLSLPIGPALAALDNKLIADVKKSAAWVAGALNQSKYRADFTVESLQEIERFFAEHSRDGRPVPGGLLSAMTGPRLFAVGSYVGEVLRRAGNGEWYAEAGDPDGEVNIEVRFPNGERIWPMQRVIKRVRNGSEENIYHYGRLVLQSVGAGGDGNR